MNEETNESRNNEIIEKEINLKNQMKNGLSWFYWIAAFSTINSILFFINADISFLAGLGITQIINVFINEIQHAKIIGLILNIVFILGFILLGEYSKKSNPLILFGIIIYSLDSIIFLFIQDWFSFGFHVFAIMGIISGYKAKKNLFEFENNQKINIEKLDIIDETKNI
ncbi:MAG: hypothetical protein A2Y30_01305 [Spirochaetes bacterium GWE1_32_154]|nr:MAG: hypothetical protein A2Y30_01305 [Spirochaetes bacterium GWE1_32_154]